MNICIALSMQACAYAGIARSLPELDEINLGWSPARGELRTTGVSYICYSLSSTLIILMQGSYLSSMIMISVTLSALYSPSTWLPNPGGLLLDLCLGLRASSSYSAACSGIRRHMPRGQTARGVHDDFRPTVCAVDILLPPIPPDPQLALILLFHGHRFGESRGPLVRDVSTGVPSSPCRASFRPPPILLKSYLFALIDSLQQCVILFACIETRKRRNKTSSHAHSQCVSTPVDSPPPLVPSAGTSNVAIAGS
jgi:hypothetical protein